ncbi:MAG: hypothetical protein AAB367_00245 [Patescibacteria group bacterium]
MKKIFFALFFVLPFLAGAHGGEQRVVDGKYIVTMSRAPFTPRVGTPTKLLISISDIKSGNVLDHDAIMHIRVARLASPGDEPQFIFEERDIKAERSTVGYTYDFTEEGFHEIYIDFAFADEPKKIFHAEDYLLDIQPREQASDAIALIYAAIAGLIVGFVFARFVVYKKIL